MTTMHKNIKALAIGTVLSSSWVWLMDLGAAMPRPVFIESLPSHAQSFYHSTITAVAATLLAFAAVILLSRSWIGFSSKQWLLCAVPMVVYLLMIGLGASYAVISVLYAALPMLLLMSLLLRGRLG